jgi:16S rRNA (adenine1518-N6/adenine1519-N6)-dimethyltransferase
MDHITQTIRAKKSLGQNFLHDQDALRDISHAIEVHGKYIVEVWPGYGALTELILAQKPSKLDLVELDTDLIPILKDRFLSASSQDDTKNISLYHQDVLTYIPPTQAVYSVIANIPYYITSPILSHFLYHINNVNRPESMVIMMQKEVWEKILSGSAKKRHHSYLSLSCALACRDISTVRIVEKFAFSPVPKIDSIVLKFSVQRQRNLSEELSLLSWWKIAFAHPRKTLLSNFVGTKIEKNTLLWGILSLGYTETVRAEALSLDDWKILLQRWILPILSIPV